MNEARVVGTLEQLYQQRSADVVEWGAAATEAMRPLLDDGAGVATCMFDSNAWRYRMVHLSGIQGESILRSYIDQEGVPTFDRQAYQQFFLTPRPVMTQREIGPLLEVQCRTLDFLGAHDMLGLITEPEPGIGLVFCAALVTRQRPTPTERSKLTRLALHLEVSARARMRPESILGTLSPSGRFELGADALDRTARDEVQRHMRAVERTRLRANRSDGEQALATWSAVTAGRVSLLERVEPGGQRLFDLCETAPRHQPLRALSQLEINVLADAARGLRNKEIAYALGISEVRVSQALSAAVAKLGLKSGHAAVRLAAGLRRATGSLTGLARLTPGERAVAELASRGLSNQQIATRRSTSPRTVANQVAAILQKTGASSRRALVQIE